MGSQGSGPRNDGGVGFLASGLKPGEVPKIRGKYPGWFEITILCRPTAWKGGLVS